MSELTVENRMLRDELLIETGEKLVRVMAERDRLLDEVAFLRGVVEKPPLMVTEFGPYKPPAPRSPMDYLKGGTGAPIPPLETTISSPAHPPPNTEVMCDGGGA